MTTTHNSTRLSQPQQGGVLAEALSGYLDKLLAEIKTVQEDLSNQQTLLKAPVPRRANDPIVKKVLGELEENLNSRQIGLAQREEALKQIRLLR